MRNQKGVTLMILVSVVIVISLIVGTIAFNSTSSLKMQVYYNMYSDIELLDEKIAIYYLENNTLPIIESEQKTINEINDSQNINYNPNNSGNLYKINLSLLDNLTLNYTNYYIDEQSHTIYSSNGVDIEGTVYYTVPIEYQKVNLENYQ